MTSKRILLAYSELTEFTIFIRENASSPETFAAQELQNYLFRICNCQFVIKTGSPAHNQPNISIGVADKTHPVATLLNSININLESDGFAILPFNNTITLIGNTPRSCLYAVYTFLEELGCRWYHLHPKDQIIPRKAILEWRPKKIISNPDWKTRNVFFTPQEQNKKTIQLFKYGIDWMVKNRFNQISLFAGEFKTSVWTGESWDKIRGELLPEIQKRGLDIELGGHVFNFYIDPKRYFKKRPDFFSMINGIRNPNAQLCLSNPDLIKEFAQNITDYFENHPEANTVTLAPNDYWDRFCECDICLLKSKNDNLMHFTNQISKTLQSKISKIRTVYTAYASYINPPDTVKPEKDLILLFCSWDRCYAHSLFDPKCTYNTNQFRNKISEWKKYGNPEMWLYEYYGTANIFRSNMIPLTQIIKQDILNAAALDFKGFLLNQTHIATWWTYAWNDYICGRVLWNMQTDTQNIFNEYSENLYGPAASTIKKHFDYMEKISRFDGNFIRRSFPRGEGKEALKKQIEDLNKIEKTVNSAQQNLETAINMQLSNLQTERINKCLVSLNYTKKDLQILKLHTTAKYLIWCAEENRITDNQKSKEYLTQCKKIFTKLKSLIKETKTYVADQAKKIDGLFFVIKIVEHYNKVLSDIKTREIKLTSKKESFMIHNSPLLMSTHDPKAPGEVSHYMKNKRSS